MPDVEIEISRVFLLASGLRFVFPISLQGGLVVVTGDHLGGAACDNLVTRLELGQGQFQPGNCRQGRSGCPTFTTFGHQSSLAACLFNARKSRALIGGMFPRHLNGKATGLYPGKQDLNRAFALMIQIEYIVLCARRLTVWRGFDTDELHQIDSS